MPPNIPQTSVDANLIAVKIDNVPCEKNKDKTATIKKMHTPVKSPHIKPFLPFNLADEKPPTTEQRDKHTTEHTIII